MNNSSYKLVGRKHDQERTIIKVGPLEIGGDHLIVIGGPCTVESEEQLMRVAVAIKQAGGHILRGGAYKPRSSPYSFRGLAKQGLELLAQARQETGLPIITEVLTPGEVDLVSEYADILQIGARSMQNFYLLEEVGRSTKPVLLKRGLAATIDEWLLAAEYILLQGNPNVILCERGIRTYENATRNTLDLSAVALAKQLSHLPVFADPSHGTGLRRLITPLSQASIAGGADGLIVEVHPVPEEAISDGPQSLNCEEFAAMVRQVSTIGAAVGRTLHPPVSINQPEAAGDQSEALHTPDRHLSPMTLMPHKLVGYPELDSETLSIFQKVLLVTDGTLTDILEVFIDEHVQVLKLSETTEVTSEAIELLELEAGSEIINRKILLQGKTSHQSYVYAESIIIPDRLQSSLGQRLIREDTPLGRLWLEHRMETFKEIVDLKRETVGDLADHFDLPANDPMLSRTYRIFSERRPVMMITEKFPQRRIVGMRDKAL